ncbi:MAG: DUF4147 domain-containing protein, partial [Candidatus Kariarchaeaceae archaeon]
TISFHLPDRLPTSISDPIRIHLNAVVKAISGVKPARRVAEIDEKHLAHENQVILSLGKNAAVYAKAFQAHLPRPAKKIIVIQAKDYTGINGSQRAGWEYWEVQHPIPTEKNFEATQWVLDFLDTLSPDTILHVIVTGGASSCFALPEEGISETHYLDIVQKAHAFGFNISTLNYIRSLVDRVKGGKLAARYHQHTIYTWCVSDVISDDPAIIGSGPTVHRMGQDERIQSYHIFPEEYLALIPTLKSRLVEAAEVNEHATERRHVKVLTKRDDLLQLLEQRLAKIKYGPIIANSSVQGDYSQVSDEIIDVIKNARYRSNTTLIWSGEPEIKVSLNALQSGKGGRISALLTLLSEKIQGMNNVIVVGIATDGVDGSSPSSGYFITAETASRLRPLGGALKIINSGNSGKVLTSLGYGIELGQTDINLLDLYFAIMI